MLNVRGLFLTRLNTAYQSGAVRRLSEIYQEKELARLLGRDVTE